MKNSLAQLFRYSGRLACAGFCLAFWATVPVAAAEKTASSRVMLGDSKLLQGIPGEGPLTVPEIKKWLSDPANFEVLDVQLPVGLDLARIPEGVLQRNPLTRAKVELGRQLYFDTRLSGDNTISCATCHDPEFGWAAPTQFGVGIKEQTGNRNSPASYNRIVTKEQFWDGRAGSLEDQAIGPIENPIEMGNTHANAVKTIKNVPGYKLQFDAIFGDSGVTIGNVGAAIAAFERMVVTGPAPYDYYEKLKPLQKFTEEDFEDDPDLKEIYDEALADFKANPMSESAIRGRDLFFSKRVNCAACHVGANLTDEKYHNLGIGMDQENPDLGRFNVTGKEEDKGAFKTPTIRNVELTGPYMHDGSLKTLLEVVEHYNKGGTPNPHLSDKVEKLNLTTQEKQDLVEFMLACTGEFEVVETGRLPE